MINTYKNIKKSKLTHLTYGFFNEKIYLYQYAIKSSIM